jgi:F0F1-type ATP synthase assembly protein I
VERETPSSNAPPSSSAGEGPERGRGTDWTAWQKTLRAVGPHLGFGFEVAGTIVFFVGGGYLLDRWLGTLPWLTVAGGALSIVGVLALIQRVGDTLRRDREKDESARSALGEEEASG